MQPPEPARIVHRPQARYDLAEIAEYLLDESPAAARKFLHCARETLETLAAMPHMGSVQEFTTLKHFQLRKWSVKDFPNYPIFYRPLEGDSGVEVYAIVHGA